jgi:hypothetical protein
VDALIDLFARAELVPDDEANPVARQVSLLNRMYGVLRHPTRIVSIDEPRKLWNFGDFKNLYMNRSVTRTRQRGRNMGVERVSIAEVWFNHHQRRAVDKLVWKPGEPRLVGEELNLWGGFGIEPSLHEGMAPKYWYALMQKALGTDAEILVTLLASLVQYPARKIGWYAFVHGKPGTGKNYIFEPLKYIFGAHYITVSVEGYLNKFNSMFSAARVIVFPEMEEGLDRGEAGKFEAELKIEADTAPHHRVVESKGVDRVQVERLANVFMFSNYHPVFKVSRGDRRGLFLEMSDEMRPVRLGGTKEDEYWQKRWEWMSENGPSEVMRFLMNWDINYDLLPAVPPVTGYKARLIGANTSMDMSDVLTEFMDNPPPELANVGMIRASDLIQLTYGAQCKEALEPRILGRAGRFIQLNGKIKVVQRRVAPHRTPIRFGILPRGVDDARSIAIWNQYWLGNVPGAVGPGTL